MRYELGRMHRPMRRSTEGQLVGLISLEGGPYTPDILVVAAGGGGGGTTNNQYGAGGGGAGGYVFSTSLTLTPGSTYVVTIGVGGVGATGSDDGDDGGNSSFVGLTTAVGGGGGGRGNGATLRYWHVWSG